jgi:hypothetical protein
MARESESRVEMSLRNWVRTCVIDPLERQRLAERIRPNHEATSFDVEVEITTRISSGSSAKLAGNNGPPALEGSATAHCRAASTALNPRAVVNAQGTSNG